MAAGALRQWQVDQAAEREAAGSHWQDTGRVFTTAAGPPLGARHIRKMFQDVCERAGVGRPEDLGAEDVHVGRHVGEDDRPDERSFGLPIAPSPVSRLPPWWPRR
jgi:hypothetical protein